MDEPWNIMMLTREEHIIAHKILYKLYGHYQDAQAVALLEGRAPDISGDKNPHKSGEKSHFWGTKQSEETLKKKAEKREANPRCQKGEQHYNSGKTYDTPRNWKGGVRGKPGSEQSRLYMKAWREKNKNGS